MRDYSLDHRKSCKKFNTQPSKLPPSKYAMNSVDSSHEKKNKWLVNILKVSTSQLEWSSALAAGPSTFYMGGGRES